MIIGESCRGMASCLHCAVFGCNITDSGFAGAGCSSYGAAGWKPAVHRSLQLPIWRSAFPEMLQPRWEFTGAGSSSYNAAGWKPAVHAGLETGVPGLKPATQATSRLRRENPESEARIPKSGVQSQIFTKSEGGGSLLNQLRDPHPLKRLRFGTYDFSPQGKHSSSSSRRVG